MNDRIEEIKARCEAATPAPWVNDTCLCVSVIKNDKWESDICECDDVDTKNGEANTEFIANAREDIPFLLGEIDHLKMMLDAAAAGQETMQKQWAADVDRLTSELSSAVGDLYEMKNCDNCKKGEEPCELPKCEYEWRGVK